MREQVILPDGKNVTVIAVGKLLVIPDISESVRPSELFPIMAGIAEITKKPVVAVLVGTGIIANPGDTSEDIHEYWYEAAAKSLKQPITLNPGVLGS